MPGQPDGATLRHQLGRDIAERLWLGAELKVLAPRRTFSMNDAMDVALFLTDRLFRNVGTRVARGLEASLPEVDAHMGRVEQALVNVLVNACEAGGSEVRVSTGMAEDGRTVLTRIEDNGCGVAEKDLPRVFEPFFSTRGKLGIGLTAARELVANEGGTLEFESKAGKGAVVTIHLPSAQQDTR